MRERAATVGGALRIASTSAGGFLVEATLPVSRVDA
jgi:signal transduction histidine kinase